MRRQSSSRTAGSLARAGLVTVLAALLAACSSATPGATVLASGTPLESASAQVPAASQSGSASASQSGSASASPTATAPSSRPRPAGDLAFAVSQDPRLRVFAQVMTEAGMLGLLHGVGPYTILAPSDQAFADLDPALLARLRDPRNQHALTRVLAYHMIPVKVLVADVVPPAPIDTLHGVKVSFRPDGEAVQVAGALIVGADVDALNGSVQVIDRVLLPPDFDEGSLQ